MGKVFISYAREDREVAEKIYSDLKDDKVDVWLDSFDILPGQDWDYLIKEVIERCSYFLAILSNNSISKKGYVQKELKIALDIMDELPPDKIFLIPIRISECTPKHEKIRRLNYVDLFVDYKDGIERIKRVVSPKSTEIADNAHDIVDNTHHIVELKSQGLIFKTTEFTQVDLLRNNLGEIQFENFKDFTNKILSDLVETYTDYLKYKKLPDEKISASIKLLIDSKEIVNLFDSILNKKAKEQITESKNFLVTIARDPNTYLNSNREVLTVLHTVGRDTINNSIINNHQAWFISNDLRSQHQHGGYQNENPNWSNYYNAAMAIPIRTLVNGKFAYLGILKVDSINKNNVELFGSSEEIFILEQTAAMISSYFQKIKGHKTSFSVKYCEKCGQSIF